MNVVFSGRELHVFSVGTVDLRLKEKVRVLIVRCHSA